jgi:hypothetical protein
MKLLLYNIDHSIFYLHVSIKKNIYWIDWDIFLQENNKETIDNYDFFSIVNNKDINILCIEDNKYYYFNTYEKKIYPFDKSFSILSIDSTKSLDSLYMLKRTYNEILYEFYNYHSMNFFFYKIFYFIFFLNFLSKDFLQYFI